MGLESRPLTLADVHAVLELTNAYDRAHFGEVVLTADDVRAEWGSPDLRLSTDSEGWVDEDGRLVAYAVLDPRGSLDLAVAPDWAGHGLSGVLSDRWEDEAERRGLGTLTRMVAADDEEAAAELAARGYTVRRTTWLLTLDPATVLPRRPLPGGCAVRPMVEADARAVHAVVRDAFSEWQPQQRSYAAWRAAVLDRPTVSVEHCRVATAGGEVVGACLVVDPDPDEPAAAAEAWVAQLAVRRDHRGAGLGSRLLAETFAAARERGLPAGGLSTDNRTGALGLYQRLGLRVRHTLHQHGLDLPPG